jgi:hypothetical protein
VTLVLFRFLRIIKAAATATTANRTAVETIVAVVRLLPPLRIESGPPRPLVVSRIPTVPPFVPPPLPTAGAANVGDSLGTSLGAKLGWSDGALLGSALGLLLGESDSVVVSINTGAMLGTVLGASLKVPLSGDKRGVLVHFGHCGIGPARGMEVSVCKDRNLGFRNKQQVSVICRRALLPSSSPTIVSTYSPASSSSAMRWDSRSLLAKGSKRVSSTASAPHGCAIVHQSPSSTVAYRMFLLQILELYPRPTNYPKASMSSPESKWDCMETRATAHLHVPLGSREAARSCGSQHH